jgi:hypothetical protein
VDHEAVLDLHDVEGRAFADPIERGLERRALVYVALEAAR